MNSETKFIKLKTRMMKWAEEKKYQTSKGGDFTIPPHPRRSRSWKEELKFILKWESQSKDLTRLQKLYLNKMWEAYKV
tara:strand:+ start:374 stop:607 length:234 start_codon:yes stop_codon:yes gene_type:complete